MLVLTPAEHLVCSRYFVSSCYSQKRWSGSLVISKPIKVWRSECPQCYGGFSLGKDTSALLMFCSTLPANQNKNEKGQEREY